MVEEIATPGALFTLAPTVVPTPLVKSTVNTDGETTLVLSAHNVPAASNASFGELSATPSGCGKVVTVNDGRSTRWISAAPGVMTKI